MIGPAEAEYHDDGERDVHRWFNCPKYSECSSIACKAWWPSFVCDACELAPWYRPPRVFQPARPKTPRVPLRVFVERVGNDPFGRGYTLDNFVFKMSRDVRQYYGEDSLEFAFIRPRLLLLRESLGNRERDDLSDIQLIAEAFSSWFLDVPDVRDVYLAVCGKVWQVTA